MVHKAGFVNILGSPNVGKSTLMNGLVGERLSIITSKKQTTRHRIMGIVNGDDFQIVYSDTPGVVNAGYKLHERMMKYVNTAISDGDVLLFVTDPFEDEMNHVDTLRKIESSDSPVLLLINKIDLIDQEKLVKRVEYWSQKIPRAEILPISALHKMNLEYIINKVKDFLPESPPYFPKDELTDRPMRFFVSEIIREKIFETYDKELPYSCEVEVQSYKEEETIVKIEANILVIRESQKGIVIGHQGKKIKHVGISARKDIQRFVDKKVHLDLRVKVEKDWRNQDRSLDNYGY
ncbi:MAG TPA: GTPase Era [Flavobacteriales bacterium]|nr:GTPase Era [Flavobacteriales bacterium]